MEKQKMTTGTHNNRSARRHRPYRATSEKPYMRFQCVRCGHCVSPGMFTADGWAVYKETELCPDCQG